MGRRHDGQPTDEGRRQMKEELAKARAILEEDSWIEEYSIINGDWKEDDCADRVVRVADMRAALDRIEEAAKREIAAAKRDAPQGNAATMREALERTLSQLVDCAPTAEQEWPGLIAQARAALAAPPRNCDLFETADEAWLAYKDECDKDETVPNMIGAISWLLAKAKKEGDAE